MPKRDIQMTRGRAGYGFTLSGQAPCFVSWISDSSSAKQAGLKIGDRVLSVNRENIFEADHEYVVRAIGMSPDTLHMEVVDGYLSSTSSRDGDDTKDTREIVSRTKNGPKKNASAVSKSNSSKEGKFYRTKRVLKELENGIMFKDVLVTLDSSPITNEKASRTLASPLSKLKASRSSSQLHSNSTIPRSNSMKGLNFRKQSEGMYSQAIVAYIGATTSRIDSLANIPMTCMSALQSSIEKLRVEQDIHQRVLLKVTSKGLKVFNADGDLMVLLDENKFCLCVTCEEDERFFSVATLLNGNLIKCYLFMVDPKMCSHKFHSEQAKRFGIHCTVGPHGCIEFPRNPNSIVDAIESLYDESKGGSKNSKTTDSSPKTGNSLGVRLSESAKKKMERKSIDGGASLGRKSKNFVSKLNMKNLSKSAENVRPSDQDSINTASSFESLNDDLSHRSGSSVASWSDSFDRLLEDPTGLHYFTEYLRKEFSEENIIFWLDCEKLRKTPYYDTTSLKEQADSIFERFLSDQASSPVNIDSTGQRLAEEALTKPPHPRMFVQQQSQIHKLMEYDSYRRFLKSDFYQRCNWSLMNGTLMPLDRNSSMSKSRDDIEHTKSSFSFQSRKFFQKKPKKSKSITEIRKEFSDNESLSLNPARSEDDILSSSYHNDSQVCKLVFWDGSSTVIPVSEGKATIRQTLEAICDKRNVSLSAVDIYYQNEDRALALDQDIVVLAGQEARVERRTLFKLDLLPIGRSIGVKAKPSKSTIDVIKPVIAKYGLELDDIIVKLSGEEKPVDLSQPVNVLDGFKVIVDQNTSKTMPRKPKIRHSKAENKPRSAGNSDTEDLIDAMTAAAECGKLNDQRGLISQIDLELPDFLKLPSKNSDNTRKK